MSNSMCKTSKHLKSKVLNFKRIYITKTFNINSKKPNFVLSKFHQT